MQFLTPAQIKDLERQEQELRRSRGTRKPFTDYDIIDTNGEFIRSAVIDEDTHHLQIVAIETRQFFANTEAMNLAGLPMSEFVDQATADAAADAWDKASSESESGPFLHRTGACKGMG